MAKPKLYKDLGVNKAPWDTRFGQEVVDKMDAHGCHTVVASVNVKIPTGDANLRLVKECPMLYKGLQAAVVEKCGACKKNNDWVCSSKKKCAAMEWRKTLARVFGTEEW